MAAETSHLETLGHILSEAGFLFSARGEQCELVGNQITTANANIVPMKFGESDAEMTTSDVDVRINGEKVEVKEVDTEQGLIELSDAAKIGGEVRVSYKYSGVELEYVKTTRDDVENLVQSKLRTLGNCQRLKEDGVLRQLRAIVRLWAGGLLLSREYGYNTDTEQTSKDGYRKIEEARTLLQELYDNLQLNCGSDDTNGGSGSVITASEGDLFGLHDNRFRSDSDW